MSAARVGVFGGTFDPPHLGHVAVAAAAFDALDLTEVWFTPAVPYHKGAAHCSTGDRVAMCAATVASVPFHASVCTVDVDRGSPTYTVDTLTELTAAHPAVELVFIAGSDVISSMHTWGPSAQRCLELATFAVAHRPGFPPPVLRAPLVGEVVHFGAPGLPEISSTAVRACAAGGGDVTGLVGAAVAAVIVERGLYRSPAPHTVAVREVGAGA